MEIRSIAKFVRISHRKARPIMRVINGKNAIKAINILTFIPCKAAFLIKKVVFSAISNAENNHNIDKNILFIKFGAVEKASMMKRSITKSRGMSGRIRKRMSHLNILLSDSK